MDLYGSQLTQLNGELRGTAGPGDGSLYMDAYIEVHASMTSGKKPA